MTARLTALRALRRSASAWVSTPTASLPTARWCWAGYGCASTTGCWGTATPTCWSTPSWTRCSGPPAWRTSVTTSPTPTPRSRGADSMTLLGAVVGAAARPGLAVGATSTRWSSARSRASRPIGARCGRRLAAALGVERKRWEFGGRPPRAWASPAAREGILRQAVALVSERAADPRGIGEAP